MIDKITWTVVNNVNDLGSAVRIKVNFYEDDVATEPTDPTIKLFDPHSGTAQTTAAMTQVSTGVYEYNFQSSSTGLPGKYTAAVTFTSDSKTVKEDDIFFYIE